MMEASYSGMPRPSNIPSRQCLYRWRPPGLGVIWDCCSNFGFIFLYHRENHHCSRRQRAVSRKWLLRNAVHARQKQTSKQTDRTKNSPKTIDRQFPGSYFVECFWCQRRCFKVLMIRRMLDNSKHFLMSSVRFATCWVHGILDTLLNFGQLK